MAWSTPLTAVANAALTAAQWNASVRDNLLMTAPAVATTSGRVIVATGTNAVTERAVLSNTVAASETTTSATYTSLSTPGPAVTLSTGTNAFAFASSQMSGSTVSAFYAFGIAVSGASTIAAADADGFMWQAPSSTAGIRGTVAVHYPASLTAGSNTFTMQYRASAGTGTYGLRKISVIGL